MIFYPTGFFISLISKKADSFLSFQTFQCYSVKPQISKFCPIKRTIFNFFFNKNPNLSKFCALKTPKILSLPLAWQPHTFVEVSAAGPWSRGLAPRLENPKTPRCSKFSTEKSTLVSNRCALFEINLNCYTIAIEFWAAYDQDVATFLLPAVVPWYLIY